MPQIPATIFLAHLTHQGRGDAVRRWRIRHYRRRVRQADALNEYAIAESLRGILVDEQDHLIALATALGIDAPDPGIAD